MSSQDKITTIAFMGDIMCGDSFYAVGCGVGSSLEVYKEEFLRKEIIEILHRHDLVIGNIESPLSNIGRKDTRLRTLHMRGRPEAACFLAAWGLNIANVANNHIFEHGFDAAVDTVNNLKESNIEVIGAGPDGDYKSSVGYHRTRHNGHDIFIFGFCLRDEKYAYNGGGDISSAMEEIQSIRKMNPDAVIIVSLHWGNEFVDRPSIVQCRIAHELLKIGVSIIAGHHPHVVQGVYEEKGGLVAYSLGNFIFDGYLNDTNWSVILTVTIKNGKIAEWHPILVGKDNEHRPYLMKGKEYDQHEEEFCRRCDIVKSESLTNEYEACYLWDVERLKIMNSKRLYKEILKRFLKYKIQYWPQILLRPIQRRLHKW